MQVYKLSDMTKGWFMGNFSPSVLNSSATEVAIKSYKLGALEVRHVHKIATEVTVILSGRARMNDIVLVEGDIVRIEPGQYTDFEALTDVTTVVVKSPSCVGDKYEC